jgi:hypothetical protein
MARIFFDNEQLVKILVENIPEFKGLISPEFEFSAYIIYGDFGIFLRDKIMERSDSEGFSNRSFGLINMLIEQGDEKIIQMLRVTTFEILTDYNETISASRKYLKGDALKVFLDVLAFIKG